MISYAGTGGWGLFLLLTTLLSLSGCTVGPDFTRPDAPKVERYTRSEAPTVTVAADGQAQRFDPNAQIVSDWWRLFNSSKLDAVIRDAAANNQGLRAAQARLRQSQADLQAGYGVFYPQLDVGFGAVRQKASLARSSGNLASNTFSLFTLAATISYTIDVFGGERRAVEGLQAQVDFQRFTLLATYLTLSGNIVNATIAQAAYLAQIEATEQVIGMQKEQVRITEAQAQAGTVPYSNLLAVQAQLAAIETTLPPLKQKLSQTEHLLATLVGRAPVDAELPQVSLADFKLPEHLPLTLPSDLVRQRPDILGAEAQLHASSAGIGLATAALFPSFTLNGGYGVNNTSMGDLLKSNGTFWNLGAEVGAPLFHGGTLQARQQAAIEGYNQSRANYRQIVLTALAQVADVLRALEHDAETLEAQVKALDAAEEGLSLLNASYEGGTANYLQVLIATGQYYQAKIGYVQAKAQRLQDTVALYVALGGGWWGSEYSLPASSSN